MHVVVGIVALFFVLAGTVLLGHSGTFGGFLYGPALLLVGVGPFCMAVTSYRLEELWACLSSLRRALGFNAARSRLLLYEELSRFATAVRGRQAAQAHEIAESASHELIRQLAPLVLRQYSPDDIERTAGTAAFVQVSALKRSEDVLTTLARVAPAAGLVGTVLGLINLLKDLQRFEQLGPSMALALLCTLYGLVLANAVFQPLARLIHSYAAVALEESKLLTRAMLLLTEEKPLADVRRLFESAGGAAAPEPGPAVGSAAGGGQ
ncbi:MAG TPA: MotA/TolQ/ExbB proton channel family protein [Myxococcaceae bacterium]|jgi:chemotaxis protein MotA